VPRIAATKEPITQTDLGNQTLSYGPYIKPKMSNNNVFNGTVMPSIDAILHIIPISSKTSDDCGANIGCETYRMHHDSAGNRKIR